MENTRHFYLDDYGTDAVIRILLACSDLIFDTYKTDDLIHGEVDDEHFPSALALMRLIKSDGDDTGYVGVVEEFEQRIQELVEQAQSILDSTPVIHFVQGDLQAILDPNPKDIYFHCINPEQDRWSIAVYVPSLSDPWLEVGSVKPYLSQLWSKDNQSVLELKSALRLTLSPLNEAQIRAALEPFIHQNG